MDADPEPDPGPGAGGRARRIASLGVLVLLPLLLRLAPLDHGLPAGYVPDTHMVRQALGMAKDKDPVPPVGRYSTYPNLLPYLLVPIYGAEYALGRATGTWGGSGEFAMRLYEEPERAHLPARALVALLAACTPWVILRAARAMGLGRGAWVAAWLTATGLLHLHFSVQERPWAPLVLFFALAAWPAALHARDGGRRTLLLSGLAAGLAFATHQAGLVALGIPGIAWALAPPGPGATGPGSTGPGSTGAAGWGRRILGGVQCVALFAVVSLLLGHPYLLVHGATPENDIAGAGLEHDFAVGGQAVGFGWSLHSVTRLSRAFFGYDPVLVVLGLMGLVPALRTRAALPATGFALLWAAFFLTNPNDHVRYLLPLSVLLTIPAGFAAERLWRTAAGRWGLVALLAFPLVQALRLDWVLAREDTRALAWRALGELPPEASVAVDHYGPVLFLDAASLARLAGWRDLYGREEHRRLLLEAGRTPREGAGIDALPLEDLIGYDARKNESDWKVEGLGGRDTTATLRALGATHVLLVDRNPTDPLPSMLVDERPAEEGRTKLAPLRLDGDPLWRISPAGDGPLPEEARLPTELDFPLTSLWQVERPGPVLELYRLAD